MPWGFSIADSSAARWVTPIFVAFDIAALLLQLVGAVMIAGTSITDSNYLDKVHRGKYIALAGVSVQILAFGLFSIIAVRFHIVARRFKDDLQKRLQPVPGEKFVTVEGIEGRKLRPNWEALLYIINISCALIMVRYSGALGLGLFDGSNGIAYCWAPRSVPSIVRWSSPRAGTVTPT